MKQIISLLIILIVLVVLLLTTACTPRMQAWPKQPCPPDDVLIRSRMGCVLWIPKGYIDTIENCLDCEDPDDPDKDEGI